MRVSSLSVDQVKNTKMRLPLWYLFNSWDEGDWVTFSQARTTLAALTSISPSAPDWLIAGASTAAQTLLHSQCLPLSYPIVTLQHAQYHLNWSIHACVLASILKLAVREWLTANPTGTEGF
jgi:hypothetical protein